MQSLDVLSYAPLCSEWAHADVCALLRRCAGRAGLDRARRIELWGELEGKSQRKWRALALLLVVVVEFINIHAFIRSWCMHLYIIIRSGGTADCGAKGVWRPEEEDEEDYMECAWCMVSWKKSNSGSLFVSSFTASYSNFCHWFGGDP